MNDWLRTASRARHDVFSNALDAPVGAAADLRPMVYESWRRSRLQGLAPDAWHLLPSQLPDANLRQALDGLDAGIKARLPQLPSLAQFLRRYAAPVPAVALR